MSDLGEGGSAWCDTSVGPRALTCRRMEPSAKRARGPTVRVPSHSAWFHLDSVSDIERKALPEFFDGRSATKTPAAYLAMRNMIVSTYREQPGLHLSVTECRRHLAADVGAIMRLHRFLEHWGLINYNASAGAPSGPPGSVLLDGPTANQIGATTAWRGGNGMLAMRPAVASGGAEWTPQETLSLLDALEAVGEGSWEEVAAQVGRSIEECVGHFLTLPIEEPYALEALAPISAAATTAATSPVGDLLKGEEPVAALNPMATQLALLAAAVGARGGGAVTEANVSGDATEVKTEAAGDANGDAVSAMDVAASSLRAAARECLEGIQVCVRRDRCGGAP